MQALEVEILEARIEAILNRIIPVYYKATAERPADCHSTRMRKASERQMLRIALMKRPELIDEYEQ